MQRTQSIDASITRKQPLFHEWYQVVVKLAELGARPPVIRDLVPAVIKSSMIQATWKAVRGESSPQGQLPQSVSFCLANPAMRLHATMILILAAQWRGIATPDNRVINVFQDYLVAVNKSPIFDINRIWFLIRSLDIRVVGLRSCKCGMYFASDTTNVADAKKCPACAIREEGVRRQKGRLKKSDQPAGAQRREPSTPARKSETLWPLGFVRESESEK